MEMVVPDAAMLVQQLSCMYSSLQRDIVMILAHQGLCRSYADLHMAIAGGSYSAVDLLVVQRFAHL